MDIFIGVILFYLGAGLGSFLSVVIYRTRHEIAGIFLGRSQCTHCKKPLVAIDLLPIISYVGLQGRCRYCKNKISPLYVWIEIISGLVCTLLYFKYPFLNVELSTILPIINGPLFLEFIRYELISLSLIAIFFYDLLYQEIPDIFTYTGIVLALIGNLISGNPLPQNYITGAAFGAIFFEIQILVSRGKWVGTGDVILGLLMGIVLGWEKLILALFLAYLIGAIFSIGLLIAKKASAGSKIPFAPFLVTGTILSVLFGSQLIDWYIKILFQG